jgi:hypothetical protein
MPSYILRNIPPDMWEQFKARAEREGIPMRALILLLIEAYADGKVTVSARRAGRQP